MTTSASLSEITVSRIGSDEEDFADVLAVEEPLEIRLQLPGEKHRAISITMRTPGDDLDLAVGFLFTEGIISRAEQVKAVRHCGVRNKTKDIQNTVVVELNEGVDVDLKRLERNFYTTSSCGVCGKSSIDALHTGVTALGQNDLHVARDVIHRLPTTLRNAQSVFDLTGGLHASALFNTKGDLEMVREDVGRHNALDKVIGSKFMLGETPLSESILLVSGRASFELVQKALMAGTPILAAVGAPSSLAVELATAYGMTLAGFVRADRFNVYCGGERIDTNRSSVAGLG